MMSQFRLPAAAQTAAINRVSPSQPGDTLRVCHSELNASLCTLSSLANITSDLLQVHSHGSPVEGAASCSETRCRADRSSSGQV
jgi:hypothetical protein